MSRTAPRIRHLPTGLHVGIAALAAVYAVTPCRAPAAALAPGSTAMAGVNVDDWQDIAALEAIARTSAERELPAPRPNERVAVGPISAAIKMRRCTGDIEARVAPGLKTPARVLIDLRCAVPTAWHIYVPVRIVGTARAVRAAHALIAGTVLAAGDVSVEQHDVSELPVGYLDDPAIAIGMTVSRAVAGGTLLTNQQLLGTKAIQRGQSVTLLAGANGISVRMPGRALSDGFVNQRVKVENISSGKIVEGIARSEQVVEIVLQ